MGSKWFKSEFVKAIDWSIALKMRIAPAVVEVEWTILTFAIHINSFLPS